MSIAIVYSLIAIASAVMALILGLSRGGKAPRVRSVKSLLIKDNETIRRAVNLKSRPYFLLVCGYCLLALVMIWLFPVLLLEASLVYHFVVGGLLLVYVITSILSIGRQEEIRQENNQPSGSDEYRQGR